MIFSLVVDWEKIEHGTDRLNVWSVVFEFFYSALYLQLISLRFFCINLNLSYKIEKCIAV